MLWLSSAPVRHEHFCVGGKSRSRLRWLHHSESIYLLAFLSLQELFRWQIQDQTQMAPSSLSVQLKLNGKCFDWLLNHLIGSSHSNPITNDLLKSLFVCLLTGLMVNTWCLGRWRKVWTWSPKWNPLVYMMAVWSKKLSSLTVGRSSDT